MCGIVAFLPRPGTTRSRLREVVSAMTDSLHHRGPDGRGIWQDRTGRVALGHTRLAILDLSPAGHQPMVSASGRYALSFNGEIYNFPSLRQRCSASGYPFQGTSDTEVICALLDQHGLSATLSQLDGMFAMAIWDGLKNRLFLACDRFGEKPLYYGRVGDGFVAASELKAICAASNQEPSVDKNSLRTYLRFGYIPAPNSVYEGVRKLAPASFLCVDDESGQHTEHLGSYWDSISEALAAKAKPYRGTLPEALADLEHLLKASVSKRMIADVPVGAFLSGGIDSSLIVSLMTECSGTPVQTYTIGMPDADYDEAHNARAISRHLGTAHTEHYATCAEAFEVIPKLSYVYDEPFGDSSQIPTLLVSRLAGRRVKVALSGDGGDELFGGYNRYVWAQNFWNRANWLPNLARLGVSRALAKIHPGAWDSLAKSISGVLPRQMQMRQPADKIQKIAKALGAATPHDLYRSLTCHWTDGTSEREGRPQGSSWNDLRALGDFGFDLPEIMMMADLLGYLPGDILVKLDRAAMSVGLETRIPFLDLDLTNFCWSLPLEWKVRRGVNKWILRQLLYRRVPRTLVDSPKSGFGIPLHEWLRGPLREWAEDLLNPALLARHDVPFAAEITDKWKQHSSGTRNCQHELWTVLMLQSWLLGQQSAKYSVAI